ncbi:MAG: DUF2318 domain-containing protein [Synergistaceae bacterium]|nr:DUF2318 domain-containing protein [Synergistaceae bacterium]
MKDAKHGRLRISILALAFSASALCQADAAGQLENGDLYIPAGEISEKAVFYPVDADGTKMEVFAVKAPDGTIRTAFNTCQVCFDSGSGYYVQEGSVFVCQNCGNRFRVRDIEIVKGGCNPVPIMAANKTVTEDGITIPKSFLLQAKRIFARWKT